jgi:hypothetical protein
MRLRRRESGQRDDSESAGLTRPRQLLSEPVEWHGCDATKPAASQRSARLAASGDAEHAGAHGLLDVVRGERPPRRYTLRATAAAACDVLTVVR